jgi:hypothetical protein
MTELLMDLITSFDGHGAAEDAVEAVSEMKRTGDHRGQRTRRLLQRPVTVEQRTRVAPQRPAARRHHLDPVELPLNWPRSQQS